MSLQTISIIRALYPSLVMRKVNMEDKEPSEIEKAIAEFEAKMKPVTPKMIEKILTFKIHKEGTDELRVPKWRKAEVENAGCPSCKQTMVVIFGHNQILYAYCARCSQYYVGEE